MLTIKIRFGRNAVFLVILATFFAGCMPPGPRSLLQGKRLLEQGKPLEAVGPLKHAASTLSTNAHAWNYLGLAYHQSGQVTNALQAYHHALRLDQDLMEAHYNIGSLWLEQNRPDLARAAFTAYTLRRGNSAAGWLKLGTAQLRLGEWPAAEKSFNEALRLQPKNVEALNGLGLVQLQRNRPREAAHLFAQALAAQPNYGPALLNLAVVSHLHLQNPAFALEKYRAYLALPAHAPNRNAVEAAVRALTQPAAESPRAPSAPAAVAGVTPDERASRVIHTNTSRAQLPPTPEPATVARTQNVSTTVARAATNTRTNTTEPVRLAPEREVRPAVDSPAVPLASVPPRVPVSSVATAEVSVASSEVSVAAPEPPPGKRSFLQQMNPVNLFRRSPSERQTPRTDQQVRAPGPEAARSGDSTASAGSRSVRYRYQSIPKLAPGDRATAERVFALGVRAHAGNRHDEAIEFYQQAIEADPAYFDAYLNLGLAAARDGSTQQAFTAYETALALRPDSVDARYNFALLLKREKYYADTVAQLERILAAHPNEARAHLMLGNLYAQELRQPARAREHYLKVLEHDPRNPEAQAIRFWLTSYRP